MTDLSEHVEAIARRILGAPNAKLSTKVQLRFGNNGSVAVEIGGAKRGQWFDHQAEIGGGPLDLLRIKGGVANGDAVGWLRSELGIDIGSNRRQEKRGRIVEAYDYRDEQGTVLYQAVRLEPKDFRQRRPDGRGGWDWSLGDVRRVLYRLPELLAAESDRVVFIPEGEKDVDRLRSLGLIATCNSEGAGKWRANFSELFKGRASVVILPDNDEAGRDHARDIVASLAPVAAQVRVVALPGLPPKGDVSDWLDAGGTRDELQRLVEATAPVPRDADSDDDRDIEVHDLGLDDWNIPPREWLLGNIFCRRKVSSIVAPGAGGKTSLRTAQLMSCAIGRPLTGEHVFQRCRVLMLSFEDDIDETRRLVRACMLRHGVTNEDLAGHLFTASLGVKPWKLAEYDHAGRVVVGALRDKITALIERLQIDIVSLDPLVKTHNIDENSNKAMDFVASLLTGIAHQYNCAVDAPHHSNKAGSGGDTEDANRGRGASSTKDAFRLVYGLRHMDQEEAEQLGVPVSERRLYIRMDSAKVNITPPSTEAKWFKLIGVKLGNPSMLYPNGDEVQAAEKWAPVGLWSHVTNTKANAILDVIDTGMPNGQRYSAAPQADDRAAWRVVREHVPELTEAQAKKVVTGWRKTGLVYTDEYDDPIHRKKQNGAFVNATKRPT